MLAVDLLELLHLLAYERHDSDSREDMLAGESLARHPVRKGLRVLVARLAQVAHEQRGVRLEAFLRLATQVPYQPLRVADVLRRHTVPHDRVEEGLALSRVEAQHLDVAAHAGQQWRQRPVAVAFPLAG